MNELLRRTVEVTDHYAVAAHNRCNGVEACVDFPFDAFM